MPPSGYQPAYVWLPRRKFQDRIWLHVVLFLLTLATTTYYGAEHWASFVAPTGVNVLRHGIGPLLLHGLWYSGTVLAILGCHELGHYVACRYYDVDATRPFFIPVPPPLISVLGVPIPPPVLTGTLGAVIRIREPIRTKKVLFDIGIAGPIAGFLVAVPALFAGMAMSNLVRMPAEFHGLSLGEPLLFKLASHLFFGNPPDTYYVNMHPMAFGSWFGLLATALNLFPMGQLDGGHISYTVFGRRSARITLLTIGVAIVLSFFSASWIVWTVLMIAMVWRFGPYHPPTIDEDVPLDRARIALAVFALVMFVLCFTPAPIEPLDLIRR